MLLTITYRGKNTEDLGYLLHKNPYRAQSFEISFGKAYVFYPEISDDKTTAALLLDIDPIDLAKGKLGNSEGGLFDYVNDRPYVSSSFMSTALVRIFGTAMNGKCSERQELADTPLDLEATIHMLSCRGAEDLPEKVFGPLGYEVTAVPHILDEKFPEWGNSPYIDLTIRGKVKLSDLLNHIYVLIPVFDRQKHYYMTGNETDKLLKHGEGWLSGHPARNLIVRRYFGNRRALAGMAISRLMESEPVSEENDDSEETVENRVPQEIRERRISLNERRLAAVRDAVIESGAGSVIDLGCGEGRLTAMLLEEKQLTRVTAADVSVSALEKAKKVLKFDRMPPYRKKKLTLMQASLTYRDDRFSGYDCACIVEVMEHLDPLRIPAFERVIFEYALPSTVIVTTPNSEYNAHYEWLPEGDMRHDDHRFEWTREEFGKWTEHICSEFGYTVEITGIGDTDDKFGSPTQMGVFRRCV